MLPLDPMLLHQISNPFLFRFDHMYIKGYFYIAKILPKVKSYLFIMLWGLYRAPTPNTPIQHNNTVKTHIF